MANPPTRQPSTRPPIGTAIDGGGAVALAGRHLCLLAEDSGTAEARLFLAAATGLGARVTHLSPARAALGDGDTGPLLARLYDAIECQGLSAQQVHALAATAAVPVFDSLAGRVAALGTPERALLLLQSCLLAACP